MGAFEASTAGLPRRTLRMELQRKGVGSSDIEAALELVDDDDEASAAVDLAIRKARATAGLEPVVRRRRMMGALMRRGFNATVAAHAVRSALEAEDEAVEEEPSTVTMSTTAGSPRRWSRSAGQYRRVLLTSLGT